MIYTPQRVIRILIKQQIFRPKFGTAFGTSAQEGRQEFYKQKKGWETEQGELPKRKEAGEGGGCARKGRIQRRSPATSCSAPWAALMLCH